jgi:hypothetical protein
MQYAEALSLSSTVGYYVYMKVVSLYVGSWPISAACCRAAKAIVRRARSAHLKHALGTQEVPGSMPSESVTTT